MSNFIQSYKFNNILYLVIDPIKVKTIMKLFKSKNLDENMLINILYYMFKNNIEHVHKKIKKYTFLNNIKILKQYNNNKLEKDYIPLYFEQNYYLSSTPILYQRAWGFKNLQLQSIFCSECGNYIVEFLPPTLMLSTNTLHHISCNCLYRTQ